MLKNLSKPVKWLVLLLVVVLVSSLFASLVQNSFWSVKVDKISFETPNGELAGYLYTPKGVDADNPAPAVVLTHGYLNNSEMQEIGAIELSRRGYVVLAFDMYDHGDSTWDTPAAFRFFVNAVSDAANYMYEQDYVLKDADGNGMIGVSGHSMGGFSSTYALIFDEMAAAAQGYRKIAVGLPVGSDFRYIGVPDAWTMFSTRSVGIIGAHWDQFFFDNSGTSAGSVVYKDFTEDEVGLKFLSRDDEGTADQGVFYDVDGGQRVIYTPNETHPLNTWSLATGLDTITFFEEAFTYQLDLHNLGELEDYGITTGTTGQVWWLKEAFTLIALIGLVGLIFPLFMLIAKLPLFNKVYKEEAAGEVNVVVSNNASKTLKAIIITASTLIAVFYLTHFMDRSAGLATLANAMYYIIGAAAVFTLLVWVAAVVKNDETSVKLANKVTLGAFVVSFVAIAYRWLLTNTQIMTKVTYWSAPSINTIAYWAIASAGLILLVVFITTPIFNFGKNVENPFGLKTSPKKLLASLLVAVGLVVGLLFLVALVEWVFLTDFRIYTFAIKIFNSHQFVAALRYMPMLFIYYFAAGVTIFVNTKNCKGWKGDLLATFLLIGPIVLFLIYQYSVLFATGVAAYPTFSLSAILCVGLIPLLAIAAIVMRRFAEKTGNIWTGVFFTTIFFTLIALANTVVYVISIA
ncbi:MAG: alpha/beta hydrolase [Candidatus Izemoplasmatales bacterium]|nr:alpha/beta hydrolase [Candidatus Izemoplasmatales bacterium]